MEGLLEWTLFGSKFSRTALVFLCQVIISFFSIITCFVNLTVRNGPNELWITVLSLSLGNILPSPEVRKSKITEEEDQVVIVVAVAYWVNCQLIHFHNAKIYS